MPGPAPYWLTYRVAVADPSTFLSTVTASSAGMVAIVGGLLVARFISLESEQQGAQRLVEEAEGRLRKARERADEAADELRQYEAARFLNQRDVLEAIADGNLEVDELRRIGGECPLTDDELSPFISGYRTEFETAAKALDSAIDHPAKLTPEQWQRLRDWDSALQQFQSIPADPPIPAVWELALERIIDAHHHLAVELQEQRREQEREALRRAGVSRSMASILQGSSLRPFVSANLPVAASRIRPLAASLAAAGRHEALRSAADRTEQQVEDIELELKGLRQRRDAIVKPGRQLWPGLLVLGWLSLVGVIVPLWEMSRGPDRFTLFVKLQFVFFVAGYVPLLAYFVWFTIRLSRARSA